MFDIFFDDAKRTKINVYPSQKVKKFIVDEMQDWEGNGIQLVSGDINAAVDNKTATDNNDGLCQNKVDASGNDLELSQEKCADLRDAILSLVKDEEQADALGDDLIAAANGSELATADEPHRPVKMGTLSLLIKRVWSGTGVSIIPWDGTADSEVSTLEGALNGLSPDELEEAVLRYHHGYFRDQREADPRFSGIANSVGNALSQIASKLSINGEPKDTGEFATPKLQVKNVALWARKDDLGIQWVYPEHSLRLKVKRADQYPSLFQGAGSGMLAYPFEFEGTTAPTDAGLKSPLCSRTTGVHGYLCHPVSLTTPECNNDAPDTINLVLCSKKTKQTVAGPDACSDFKDLFLDDGQPILDPNDSARINPNLTQADKAKVCSPDTKILYQDDISAHACYISLCVAQSMSGHTLVPNRNTVVTNEATSPYLSCIRADPQLGLYSESAVKSPFPLPAYVGDKLVQDFEREYCLKNGDAARPTLGDCIFKTDQVANSPSIAQERVMYRIVTEASQVAQDQDAFLSLASAIGQRAALDQTVLMEQKLFASVAQFIQQMADLFLELKRAPVTTVACPWTGPFHELGK